jgi:translation initiation factor IF-3
MARDTKRINWDIKVFRVRVISETWEQLWIMPTEQALELAEKADMDLVEIWEQDWVVLCKILDYGKQLFKQQKNISKAKTNSKKTELKTIRLTYRIWDHDIDIRRNQSIKFAKDWHPLKVNLMLKWRENQYALQASEKVQEFVNSLEEYYKLDWRVTKAGNTFYAMLHPKK